MNKFKIHKKTLAIHREQIQTTLIAVQIQITKHKDIRKKENLIKILKKIKMVNIFQ